MTSKAKSYEDTNEGYDAFLSQKASYEKKKKIRKWFFIVLGFVLLGFGLYLIRLAMESAFG